MVELSPPARKIYDILLMFGAESGDGSKSAEQIMEKAKMGKGMINQALDELMKKGVVERMAKQKRAGYYVVQKL